MLYSIVLTLAVVLGMPFWLAHRKTRPGFAERFGFYGSRHLPQGTPRIWLHGASAGDLLSLSPMIKLLKKRFPQSCLVVSALTDSGAQMARTRMKDDIDEFIFVPWDTPFATRRAMERIKPDLLVLEYTEIWPNLIRAAKEAGAKVVITNGRFSPKHLNGYRRLFALTGHPLQNIDVFLMREPEEAERALILGAPKERVVVTGNTKFDALAPLESDPAKESALRQALDFPEGAPVFIAGSTHEGEEPLVIGVYKRLLERHPDLCLAIAPRYIDRAARIAAAAESAGFKPRLKSAPLGPNANRQTRVAVIDTIGELTLAYSIAKIVFVGGSFCKRGGQNILEPAAQGKPVLFGPNMDNFKDSVRLLVGRGGIQVQDPDHLFRVVDELLAKEDELRALGELALKTVSSVRGASERNVAEMMRALAGEGTIHDACTLLPAAQRNAASHQAAAQERDRT